MKRVYHILPLLFLLQSLCGLAQQAQFAFGGAGGDAGNYVIQTSDKGFAVAGITTSFGAGGWDMYIVKMDSVFNIQWTRTIGGPSNDGAGAIAQTTDGGYIVGGYTNSFGQGNSDLYVARLDKNGNVLWTKTIGGGANDQPLYNIIQTSDKGFAAASGTYSYGNGGDVYVIKLDSVGTLQWTRTIGGASDDRASALVQTSDGGYGIAGQTSSYGAGGYDFYFIRLNSLGNLQWTRTVGVNWHQQCFAMCKTADKGFIMTGTANNIGAGNTDNYVVKIDSAGALQWTSVIGGTGYEIPQGLTQAKNGNYIVVGSGDSYGAGASDMYINVLGLSGNLISTRAIGGKLGDDGRSVIQTKDGHFVLTGATSSFGSGGLDMYVVKVDSLFSTCLGLSGGNFTTGGTASSGGSAGIGGVVSTGGTFGTGGIKTKVCCPVNISSTNNLCFGTGTGTASVSVSGSGSPYTYAWTNGQTNSNATGLVGGTYTVTVSDASGCTQTASASVTQPPDITTNTASTGSNCAGNNGSASITASGGTGTLSYSWFPGGQTNTSATGLSAGNYTVTVSDNNGCTKTVGVPVNSTGAGTASIFTVTMPPCFGSSGGSASASITGGTSPYTYSWSNGQSTTIAGGLSAGNYAVTITDANGCVAVQTVSITQPVAVAVAVGSTNTTCGQSNGSASVTATGGTGTYTYSWSNATATATATGLSAGTYTVTITDANGCTLSQTVNVAPAPGLNANATALAANCGKSDGSASVTASGGSGAYTYSWSNGATQSSINNLQSTIYTVTITDAAGCTTTAIAAVGSNSGPTATATAAATTIVTGSSTSLTGTGGTSYIWNPSTALSCSNCPNPTASPTITTQYCVTVTDQNGCTDVACVTVFVDLPCPSSNNFSVPNAFSPNGDGHNDIFRLQGWEDCIASFVFMVYDRWGTKVYESEDPANGWDGTLNGKELDAAVFAYYISATNQQNEAFIKKGNITLMR